VVVLVVCISLLRVGLILRLGFLFCAVIDELLGSRVAASTGVEL